MSDIWLVRVSAFNWDESVQYLELLLALFIVPDDVCRDLELLLEHAFHPTQVSNVSGRHEVISVYHHDGVVFPRVTRNPHLYNESV